MRLWIINEGASSYYVTHILRWIGWPTIFRRVAALEALQKLCRQFENFRSINCSRKAIQSSKYICSTFSSSSRGVFNHSLHHFKPSSGSTVKSSITSYRALTAHELYPLRIKCLESLTHVAKMFKNIFAMTRIPCETLINQSINEHKYTESRLWMGVSCYVSSMVSGTFRV